MKNYNNFVILFFGLIRIIYSQEFGTNSYGQTIKIKLNYYKSSEIYYGEINLGKQIEQNNFQVLFDTGSSTNWLFGEKCLNCKSRKQLRKCEDNCINYQNGSIQSVFYGTGNVQGFFVIDFLNLKENSSDEVKKIPMNILLLTKSDKFMLEQSFDGIIGLSFTYDSDLDPTQNINPISVPFIKMLFKENLIEKQTFSIMMQKEEGTIQFGGYNRTYLDDQNSFNYFQIEQNQLYWKVKLLDLTIEQNHSLLYSTQNVINDQIEQSQVKEDYLAHFDSGSNVIMVDIKIAQEYILFLQKQYSIHCILKQINNTNLSGIVCACKDGIIENKFPNLFLKLNSTQNQQIDFLIHASTLFKHDKTQMGQCNSQILIQNQQDQLVSKEILIGVPFFEEHLLYFDTIEKQVGIGRTIYTKQQNILSQKNYLKYGFLGIFSLLIGAIAARHTLKSLN